MTEPLEETKERLNPTLDEKSGNGDSRLSPDLTEALARFEARMALRGESPTEGELPKKFGTLKFYGVLPPPFTKAEAKRQYDEIEAYLEGPRRLEWLYRVAGEAGLKHTIGENPKPHEDIVAKLKKILEDRRHGRKTPETRGAMVAAVRTIAHMAYLKTHFPWVMRQLSRGERDFMQELVEKFSNTAQDLLANEPEMEDTDWLALDATVSMKNEYIEKTRGWEAGTVDEIVMQESAWSGHSAGEVMKTLGLDEEDLIPGKLGAPYLEIGPGLSTFATELRQRGITRMHTLDELSYEDLIQKGLELMEREGINFIGRANAMGKFATEYGRNSTTMNKWHKKGEASEIPSLFGEGRFAKIFAHDSIIQPTNYGLHAKNPDRFWRTLKGVLAGLSPQGGTFYASVLNKWMLYTPLRMEQFMLPFLMALQAGRFEIPECHDEEGRFSWERFLTRYASWEGSIETKSRNDLRIRRHPESDLGAANRFMEDWLLAHAT